MDTVAAAAPVSMTVSKQESWESISQMPPPTYSKWGITSVGLEAEPGGKYKEEPPLPHSAVILGLAVLMSRQDKDWLLKSYWCSPTLADRNWRHLRWQVPSEEPRVHPRPALPSYRTTWPTLSAAQMAPSWLRGVWHLCSLVFSHTTCSSPLPAFLFSVGPELWSFFILVHLYYAMR